jgi:hypothetical protein
VWVWCELGLESGVAFVFDIRRRKNYMHYGHSKRIDTPQLNIHPSRRSLLPILRRCSTQVLLPISQRPKKPLPSYQGRRPQPTPRRLNRTRRSKGPLIDWVGRLWMVCSQRWRTVLARYARESAGICFEWAQHYLGRKRESV